MLRDVDINEISDGKRYHAEDMVKVGCGDCLGCSACCRKMEGLIILDPYDICRLKANLGLSFEQLLAGPVTLGMCDMLILPSLKMKEDGACAFLNENERCMIHPFRPGICRLFPLGRIYENGEFSYFLQTGECEKTGRTKIKVKKWLGEENLKAYEIFVNRWHYFLNAVGEKVEKADETLKKQICMYLLGQFYYKAVDLQSFFETIETMIKEAEEILEV